MRHHKARVQATNGRQKCGQARRVRVAMALNTPFGYVGELVNANSENVKCFRRILAVKITTADSHVAMGKNHWVICGRV